MIDAGRITCEQLHDWAAEFALGILPGRQRAAAVAHLQHCPACREEVRELAQTTDGLVDLIPAAEPPPGFESRTLQRIGVPSRPRLTARRPRRLARSAAAAAVAFTLAFGGWAIGNGSAPTTQSVRTLFTAALTAGSRQVGKAFVYTGSSPWVYMAVDADEIADDGRIRCQIMRADGSTATIGTFRLDDGYANWGGPYPARAEPVTGLRLLNPDGSVLATSTFPVAGR